MLTNNIKKVDYIISNQPFLFLKNLLFNHSDVWDVIF